MYFYHYLIESFIQILLSLNFLLNQLLRSNFQVYEEHITSMFKMNVYHMISVLLILLNFYYLLTVLIQYIKFDMGIYMVDVLTV